MTCKYKPAFFAIPLQKLELLHKLPVWTEPKFLWQRWPHIWQVCLLTQ